VELDRDAHPHHSAIAADVCAGLSIRSLAHATYPSGRTRTIAGPSSDPHCTLWTGAGPLSDAGSRVASTNRPSRISS
jgi:hypothetical protein